MSNVWVVVQTDCLSGVNTVVGVCSSKEKAVAVKNYYEESLDDCYGISAVEYEVDLIVGRAIKSAQHDIQKLEATKILLNELRRVV